MRQFFIHTITLLAVVLATTTLSAQESNLNEVKQITDDIRLKYAPDKRVAIFNIGYTVQQNSVTLTGRTTQEDAHATLIKTLRDKGYAVIDNVTLLPNRKVHGETIYGIINISTCALRSSADYSSEMVTQALLGMPV